MPLQGIQSPTNTHNMDKNAIVQKIETAFANFSSAVAQHDDINCKRADGGWSVGEIAGHIVKSTQNDLGATRPANRPYDANAASIAGLFLDFSQKFPAAPELQPDDKEYDKDSLFAQLEHNKSDILEMVVQDDLTEECLGLALPGWGYLTKYEWLVLFETHITRHTKQVNDFNTVH